MERERDSILRECDVRIFEIALRFLFVSNDQPMRESELFSITWKNTQRKRLTTIRFDRVMVHMKYHKGQQQIGRYKENIQFLADLISSLLMEYIVYVQPLRQLFF